MGKQNSLWDVRFLTSVLVSVIRPPILLAVSEDTRFDGRRIALVTLPAHRCQQESEIRARRYTAGPGSEELATDMNLPQRSPGHPPRGSVKRKGTRAASQFSLPRAQCHFVFLLGDVIEGFYLVDGERFVFFGWARYGGRGSARGGRGLGRG